MNIPKKTKYRKSHRGSMRGISKGARELAFGDFGLVAKEPCWLTAQTIEAMRKTVSKHLKKKGSFYIRVFADHPVSKKPAETRMGKGKGDVEWWVAVVKRERILFEVSGIDLFAAKVIFHEVASKLPIHTRVIVKNNDKVSDIEDVKMEICN